MVNCVFPHPFPPKDWVVHACVEGQASRTNCLPWTSTSLDLNLSIGIFSNCVFTRRDRILADISVRVGAVSSTPAASSDLTISECSPSLFLPRDMLSFSSIGKAVTATAVCSIRPAGILERVGGERTTPLAGLWGGGMRGPLLAGLWCERTPAG